MHMRDFSIVNKLRCEEAFKHNLASWSTAEWTNAMAGEVGESCNAAKKLLRHRDKLKGNLKQGDKNLELLKHKVAEEACDAIVYADLLIQSLGLDTETMLRFVFDRKSQELGSTLRAPS